jgi:hypothetical protein
MTKGELITKLKELPGSDDMQVAIWDHRKCAHESTGEDASEGIYSDFDVHLMNDDATDDEKEYYNDRYDSDLSVFVAISFDNPDYED